MDVFKALSFADAVFRLPTGSDRIVVQADETTKLMSASLGKKAAILALQVVRLLISVCLFYAGSLYLVHRPRAPNHTCCLNRYRSVPAPAPVLVPVPVPVPVVMLDPSTLISCSRDAPLIGPNPSWSSQVRTMSIQELILNMVALVRCRIRELDQ